MTAIYGLRRPRTETIRYVGRTKDPRGRRHGHVSGPSSSPVGSWVSELKEDGLRPEMVVLEECDDSICAEREAFWIRQFRGSLLNQASYTPPRAQDLRDPMDTMIHVKLPPDDLHRAHRCAAATGMTLSGLVRMLLDGEVERLKAAGKL